MSPSPRADRFYHAVHAELFRSVSVWERRLAYTTRAARLAAVLGLIGFLLPWIAFAGTTCGPTITPYRLAAHLADTWPPAGWGLIIACTLYGLVACLHRRAQRLYTDTQHLVACLYADLRTWETHTPEPAPPRVSPRHKEPRFRPLSWIEAARCLLLLTAVGVFSVLAEPETYRPPRDTLPRAAAGRPFLRMAGYPAVAVDAAGGLRVYAPGGRFTETDPAGLAQIARVRADAPWVVYAEKAASYGAVEDGLELLRRAGITRLRLMCAQPRGD